jgi:ribosomal protein S12 methylthiotransferase accessory factor
VIFSLRQPHYGRKGASDTGGAALSIRSLELLRLAADALERGATAADPRAADLIEALDYAAPRDQVPVQARPAPHDVTMLRFASRFDDIFQLNSPHAPGLALFGALVAPALAGDLHREGQSVSVTGRGMTLRAAFEGCVGEAIEYVSQLERDGDAVVPGELARAGLDPVAERELARALAQCEGAERGADWMRATRLSDGQPVLLPADFCLRRPPGRRAFDPPFLLGAGTAAGRTLEAATLHAALELIERDALGLWWKGGRRGFAVDAEAAQFDLTLAALRRGRGDRKTWLLDITTDIDAPCIVAVSATAQGDRFAFGAAARLHVADAARTALLELAQMELAYDIVERKLGERGAAALNPADRLHLRRAAGINANACLLTQPLPQTRSHARRPADLAEIVARAAKLGVEFHRLDLTRPSLGVPAVRVVAPALQLEPSQLTSERLRRAIATTGGGEPHTNGTPLL